LSVHAYRSGHPSVKGSASAPRPRFIIASVTQTQPRPAAREADQAGALPLNRLRGLQASFVANPAYRVAQNAVTRNSLDDVALNHRVAFGTDHSFSISLDDWGVTDQKQTGRCWMFAGLNLLRFAARRSLGVKEFEFSQNYLMFWDKIERANYFFEAIVESADRPIGDRSVAFLLDQPLSDGGQWNMFINLIRKHGLVPKACMPETDSSSNSRRPFFSFVTRTAFLPLTASSQTGSPSLST